MSKLIESLFIENKKLTRTGTKKVTESSKRKLSEDFSEDFPDWVKDALRPFKHNGYRSDTHAYDRLANKSIDFSRAKFVETEPPASNRDPILRDPNKIPIFMLQDYDWRGNPVTAYFVPGSSEYSRSHAPELHRPGAGSQGTISADEAPWKLILDKTLKFGYIDLSDPSNKNTQLKRDRANAKARVANITRGRGQYQNDYGTWVTARGQDKSGYPLDPNKYVRKLNDVGLDNYSARLERMYQQIEAIRSELIRVMTNVDLINPNYREVSHFGYGTSSDIADAVDDFAHAIGEYKSLLRDSERIVSRKDTNSEEDINKWLSDTFKERGLGFKKYLNGVKATIKNLDDNPQRPSEY